MGKKKKNPNYDAERIFKEYIEAVTGFYQGEDASGQGVSIRATADEFGTTILKIRKILITAVVFHSEVSEKVQELYFCGKTIQEIQTAVALSRASVYSYLPYVKTIYNANEISTNNEPGGSCGVGRLCFPKCVFRRHHGSEGSGLHD